MSFFRALLRNGLFGVLLAYVLAAQALLAGPLLAAPVSAAHQLCLTGEAAPDDGPHHAGGSCCLAAPAFQAIGSGPAPASALLAMRDTVPVLYAAALRLWSEGQGPESPAARGPPLRLV
ncbi:hypothetical protein KIH24_11485 [Rhizobiales bacterium TNE-4]|nr:hypothetical protein [Rhizobiales bacterium TNE-4]MBV1828240.1 hypothetical protein [Rhizobiales bacterium TNE-4]